MRLRLTIVQAAGSGLTCLILILKAMRIYANFPWWVVAALYGNEMANVETATTAVGDNPYYGFKKDLGAVKSRLYKNIAWVAKELLVRINGETTLNNYKWIPRNQPDLILYKA